MKKPEYDKNVQQLVEKYFSNPENRVNLRKDDVLMVQAQFNDRIYLVRKGSLIGIMDNPDGSRFELFEAVPNSFIGLYSFFSKENYSSATVYATEDSELYYLDNKSMPKDKESSMLYQHFMPVVVTELLYRGMRAQEIAMEKEQTLKKLINTEKMASLGQMAAGIAHELNNAISVLRGNSKWLSGTIADLIKDEEIHYYRHFDLGLENGRSLSSRDVRKRSKEIKDRFDLDEKSAQMLAQTGLNQKSIKNIIDDSQSNIQTTHLFWEIGATLHDMSIASQQAAHVVNSVRELAQKSERKSNQNVNESINEALILLQSCTRSVNVKLNLASIPLIEADKGELVQIWSNIIKNACDSMAQAKTINPELRISSFGKEGKIVVKIQDNGPGISKNLLPKIFQPNVTTKVNGLSFGLGLGLTIVQRLVGSYGGSISVKSNPGKTTFIVKLPGGGQNEKT